MADYETLYPGRFLKKESLAAPKVIRILSIIATQLEGEKGVEPKVVLKYKAADGEGEIVWCKTNAALAAVALGERDYTKWANRLLTIHNNPTVDLKGKKVGGIRVFGAPDMTKPQTVEIKRPRRKNPEIYRLVPTDKQGRELGAGAKATATEPPREEEFPVNPDAADLPPVEMGAV